MFYWANREKFIIKILYMIYYETVRNIEKELTILENIDTLKIHKYLHIK